MKQNFFTLWMPFLMPNQQLLSEQNSLLTLYI